MPTSLAALGFTLLVSGPQTKDEVARLTPERARRLVRERSGKMILDGPRRTGHSSMDGVTSLAAETAWELAGHDHFGLSLHDLTTLDAATADAPRRSKATVFFTTR